MKVKVGFHFRFTPVDEEPRVVEQVVDFAHAPRQIIPMAGHPLSQVVLELQPTRRGLMRFAR